MSLGMSPAIGQRLLGGQQGGGPFMGRDFMGQSAPPMSQALKQQVDDEARTNLGKCGGPRDKRPRGESSKGRMQHDGGLVEAAILHAGIEHLNIPIPVLQLESNPWR